MKIEIAEILTLENSGKIYELLLLLLDLIVVDCLASSEAGKALRSRQTLWHL